MNVSDSCGAGELTEQELRELLEGVGGLTAMLAKADSAERQQVYRAAGVHLRYQRSEEGERVTASLRVGLFRVGGPTWTRGPRPLAMEDPWSDLCRAA